MRTRIFGIVLATALLFTVGCGKRDSVVALVGKDRVITVEDFQRSFGGQKSKQAFESMSDEEKKKQLDQLIERHLKLIAAYDLGLSEDSIVVKRVMDMKRRLVSQKLYEVEVLDRMIKESDIREYYARMGKEVVLRKIVITDPVSADSSKTEDAKARAESLIDRIEAGEDFSTLAREFSEDAETARKGGLLEPMSWNGGLDPILKAAFSMKAGDVSGPIRTRQGFNIIKLEETRDRERKPYSEARAGIKQMLQREKAPQLQKAAGDYLEALKQSNQVRFYEKGLSAFAEHVKDIQDPVPTRLMLVIDGLDDVEKSRVLVSYRGEDFTILSFKDFLQDFPAERPLYFTSSPLIKNAIDRWLSQELVFERGLKRRLDKDPLTQERLREVREAYMLQVIDEHIIGDEGAFTEEDVEAYYQEHIEDKYTERARVKVQEVMVKDVATADRVARLAKSGSDFDELVREYTERLGYKKRNGVINYFVKGRWGAMGDAAFLMTIGEIRGPIDLGNDQGYSIIKLLDKTPPAVQALDEIRDRVERDLQRSLEAERRDDWLEEKRSLYGVQVYEDVLKSAFAGS